MQGNILVNDKGDVQLTDFGMSSLPGFNAEKYASTALLFHSPELLDLESFRVKNDRPSRACDIYSLSHVAVEVMSCSVLVLYAAHDVYSILSLKAVHRRHAVWRCQDR